MISNARIGDIVIVVAEGPAKWLMGIIANIHREEGKPLVEVRTINGSRVFSPDDVELRCRVGNSEYESLRSHILESKDTCLDPDQYNVMIDLAIDLEDWEWANELIEKRDSTEGEYK